MNNSPVSTGKWEKLLAEMAALNLFEADITERFILGSGAGGQKVNKTSSCVYIKHLPSGVEVKCQQSRSRELNRLYARRELCERIREQRDGEASLRRQQQEKIRRQKRRRSRRSKARMLEDKRHQGAKKSLRKNVGGDGD